jgi:heat shock protein HtpX
MNSQHADFHTRATDWRESLKQNQRRTTFVIASFIFIYLLIGFVIDLYIATGQYPNATLPQLMGALITLRIIPFATFITGIVAVISVWVVFIFHDKLILMGAEYHEITPQTAQDVKEQQLYNVIEEMKVAAGLQYMPKVFLIDAEYMNAFASGYSEKSAMVAITRGLLEKLDRDELTAVMAHELSHIRHMDIKLTLMASVLSNITLMLVDLLFWNALFSGRDGDDRENSNRNALFIVIIILRYVLPLITVLLTLYLSRTREYMADAGCVELMRNNEPLARALLKIQNDHTDNSEKYTKAYASTPHESVRRQAYIFDPTQAGIATDSAMSDYFSTHPSIAKRLAAIGIKITQ